MDGMECEALALNKCKWESAGEGLDMMSEDTIAAIATGLTDSGIGIVRISGKGALQVGDALFRFPAAGNVSGGTGKFLSQGEDHRLYYGFVYDPRKDFTIDEVMAVAMRGPRSFTGEDTVEIQCHGGVLVMGRILEAALGQGARMAQPGEFTKRAFLNGRIDLTRAEAVMDLIRSQNDLALGASVSQLQGALWKKIERIRGEILHETAFIESALDDPEHYSLEGYPKRLLEKAAGLRLELEKLAATADNGRIRKEGIDTVILGRPNVGKSSLLNCLAGEERAIVTDVAGTTRDLLQETVRLGDLVLNLVDTAGIRPTDDVVEKIGVDRARKHAAEADLVLYVVDASGELDENDRETAALIRDKNVIVLLNKSDLPGTVREEDVWDLLEGDTGNFSQEKQAMEGRDQMQWGGEKGAPGEDSLLSDSRREDHSAGRPCRALVKTCARSGEGLDLLEKAVKDMFFQGDVASSGEVVITSMRHKEALLEACGSLGLVASAIEEGMPEDFFSIDLMGAYSCLGRITGEEVDDDLVEEIFSKFCMGK